MFNLFFAAKAIEGSELGQRHYDELQKLFGGSVPRIEKTTCIHIAKETGQPLAETAILEDGRALFVYYASDGAPLTIVAESALALLQEAWAATVDERNVELADDELAGLFTPLLDRFYTTRKFN